MYNYTYLNQYGYEQTEKFKTLKEALVYIARNYERGWKTPITLRGMGVFYQQQDILLLCHKNKLL